MEVTRTVKLKISLPPDVAAQLTEAYTAACNFASSVAFTLKRPSSNLDLNRAVYRAVREQFGLTAQIAQSCIRVVAARYGAMKSNGVQPKKPVSFSGEPVLLQGGERGRDFSIKNGVISLSTLHGRVKGIPFSPHPRLEELQRDWSVGGASLFVRQGKVYLAVSCSKEVEPQTAPHNALIGVDRGLKNIAAVSDGENDLLVGGKALLDKRDKYQAIKASIQSRKAKRPTSSLRKLLKRLSGQERRYATDVDHVVSKQIVAFARCAGSPVIALEQLGGLRDRTKLAGQTKKRLHRWSFLRLAGFIEYKAQQEGMAVIRVDARYTTQGCSRCGHTEKANRNGEVFKCRACGFEMHADLQAARNIRLRGLLARQGGGGAVSHPEVAALDPASGGLPSDKRTASAVSS